MSEIREVGQGLRVVFWGEVIGIAGSVLAWIPLIGGLLAMAGVVMELYGLYRMSRAVDSYRTAFYCGLVSLVVSAFSVFVNGTLVVIGNNLINLLLLYCVCTTTAGILEGLGGVAANEEAHRGMQVWKINLVCTVVGIGCMLLAYIPVLNMLAALVSVIMLVVSLVGGILYLIFLYKSQAILQAV